MESIERRREGFPGQHHCVLPPAIALHAARHPLLRGLAPTDAGLYPHAAGHYVERERGAPGTVLIVCCQGCGWVRVEGHETRVESGVVVVLPPNQTHAYGADDDDPWTIEWVHFNGTEAGEWRSLLLQHASAAVLHIPAGRVDEVNLAAVHEHLERGYNDVQLLRAAAALRTALTEIVRLRQVPGALPSALAAVDAAAEWMRLHLDRRVTLAELAGRACLSPSHFSEVFRRRFGYAPIDWLIRQRVHRACSLLQTRQDKVAAVAREVGFEDAYYFSRVFRRVMGIPPQRFRQMHGQSRPASLDL